MYKTLADVHRYMAQESHESLQLPRVPVAHIKDESTKQVSVTAEGVSAEKVEELRLLEKKVEQLESENAALDTSAEGDKEEVDDEDVEVEEVTICDELYYTDDAESGTIYACLQDGTVGDEVGHFEDGHAFFS